MCLHVKPSMYLWLYLVHLNHKGCDWNKLYFYLTFKEREWRRWWGVLKDRNHNSQVRFTLILAKEAGLWILKIDFNMNF